MNEHVVSFSQIVLYLYTMETNTTEFDYRKIQWKLAYNYIAGLIIIKNYAIEILHSLIFQENSNLKHAHISVFHRISSELRNTKQEQYSGVRL